MKRLLIPVLGLSVLLLSMASVEAQKAPTSYAGVWRLDRDRSKLDHDLSKQLKDFEMTIRIEGDQLTMPSEFRRRTRRDFASVIHAMVLFN